MNLASLEAERVMGEGKTVERGKGKGSRMMAYLMQAIQELGWTHLSTSILMYSAQLHQSWSPTISNIPSS